MIVSFIQWLLSLLVILAVSVFTDTTWAIAGGVLLGLMPILSWMTNFLLWKQIESEIFIAPTAEKNCPITGTIRFENGAGISTGRVFCNLMVENRLTGEKEQVLIQTTIPAKGECEASFELKSSHCGYVNVYIEELVLTDWFGFLPLKCKVYGEGKVSVLPETFAPHVSMSVSFAKSEEAENWSQIQKGQDYTEIFALRDYADGDNLKQIHWKLSSKRNQLIVKEASLPTTKSMLLLWDKNTENDNAETMDAMAEVVSSVAQAVSGEGMAYCLGWTEGKECIFEDIETSDDLLQTIPRLVKSGGKPEYESGTQMCERLPKTKDYGKVIYFASHIPEDFVPIGSSDMTMILAGDSGDSPWRTYTFQPDSYETDLQAIEL